MLQERSPVQGSVRTSVRPFWSLRTFVRRLANPGRNHSFWSDRAPIREELFSVERLEAHARSLALAQIVRPGLSSGRPFAARLSENSEILRNAYSVMAGAIDEGRPTMPAAEWLIDNYHVVEKQIHNISLDLPSSYYRQLPKLLAGPFAGYPRVFGMAWAFVAHTDSHFDCDMWQRFVRALSRGPAAYHRRSLCRRSSITLRIVLIEKPQSRLATQIVEGRAARDQANAYADRLLQNAERPNATFFAELDRKTLSDVFAVQFVHRLRDQDGNSGTALDWLDKRLRAEGQTVRSGGRGSPSPTGRRRTCRCATSS